jgi:hypothetical protein
MTTGDAARIGLAWLATYGLHSTLFLGGAWLACALRPPRVNRARERLWKLALVGGVLSATLQLGLGARPLLGCIVWWPVEPPPASLAAAPLAALPLEPARSPASVPEPARARGTRVAALRAGEESSSLPLQQEGPREVIRLARALEPLAPSAGDRASPELPRGLREPLGARLSSGPGGWPALVFLGWTAVGCLGLAGCLASWSCLRRRMLGRRILSDGPLVEMLDALRARAHVRTRVRLSVSARIPSPFTTGILRPEVCLPLRVLEELGHAQQEALLAHELAHVVRRDPAWLGLGFLIERLFFFQPLNRLARARLSELAEVASDDWAVRWTGARVALASCLTQVAGWVVGERPRLAPSPGLSGQRSRLAQRVERLLDDRRSPAGEPSTPWWPPLAAASLALAALSVPGVSAVHARVQPAEASGRAPRPGRPSEPVALARHSASPPTPVAFDGGLARLAGERAVLESELSALEGELAALHEELEARALHARFAEALARIDARMAELRVQHRRVRLLLAQLEANTHPGRPTPAAEPHAPTNQPGEPR